MVSRCKHQGSDIRKNDQLYHEIFLDFLFFLQISTELQ